ANWIVNVAARVGGPGLSEVVLEARVAGPQAWWPRGYGEQPLYDSVLSVAVVQDTPGVTRDRVSYPAEWA
ncbi:putative beta-mannosidase, partial [human gut metagenome]